MTILNLNQDEILNKLLQGDWGWDGTKWGASDFYPELETLLRNAIALEVDFETAWIGCKKEIISSQISREGNTFTVTLCESIDELWDLADTAFWEATGKKYSSGLDALSKVLKIDDEAEVERIFEKFVKSQEDMMEFVVETSTKISKQREIDKEEDRLAIIQNMLDELHSETHEYLKNEYIRLVDDADAYIETLINS